MKMIVGNFTLKYKLQTAILKQLLYYLKQFEAISFFKCIK